MIVLTSRQLQEEIPRINFELCLQAQRVIDLVRLPFGNQTPDLLDGGVICVAINGWEPDQCLLR